jgi:hypothetical protein
MYKLIKNEITNTINVVFRSVDNACIPFDPANSDYQRYLNPEAEHFTPMIPGDE